MGQNTLNKKKQFWWQHKYVPVLPEGALRAGGGSGLFGRRRHGALVLLTQCVDDGVIVGGGGSAVLGGRLVADGLHTRTTDNRSQSLFYSKQKVIK